MSMPQVHIVAYCGDLGYGVARGAEMLSLMLGFGIISRIGSGFLADKIGGIRTLLIGSVAQGTALLFYLFFDSLTSLYVISAMFGLFQGGIVPSYAIIVREAMPAVGSRDTRGHRDLRLRVRHVVRRLDLGRDLRCHRLLCRGVPERGVAWNALNVAHCRGGAAAARPPAHGVCWRPFLSSYAKVMTSAGGRPNGLSRARDICVPQHEHVDYKITLMKGKIHRAH